MNSLVAEFPLDWPEDWPETPPDKRLRGMAGGHGYTPAWADVIARLKAELNRMGAESIVLSTNQPLRRDGQPTAARVKIQDPGVAVYFTFKGKDLVMAQDRYQLLTDNIRSICLQIEGLRKMERHGGGVMLERAFMGFQRLPAPENMRAWRSVFGIGDEQLTLSELKRLYRRLAAGGSVERMQTLNAAYREAQKELRGESGRAGHGR